MAKRYRPVERDQGFLLPPDMRDWLQADHPVWLLIEVVAEHLDTSAVHAGRRVGGAGRAGFDPDMLLTVLIWAWARGVRSSRRIERLCQEDVSFRVICGGAAPDHVTVHRFRVGCAEAATELFAQVLMLCARLGMGRLETVALDGTKIAANASKEANRDAAGLVGEAEREARRVAERVAGEHADTDTAEDGLFGADRRGDEVPASVLDPSGRAARIAAAQAELAAAAEQQAGRVAGRDRAAAEHLAQRQRAIAGPESTAGPESGGQGVSGGPVPRGRVPRGRVPRVAAVAVAEAELAAAIAAQQAKIEDYQRRRAQTAVGGAALPRQGPPRPVEDHHQVRRWRARLAAARERAPDGDHNSDNSDRRGRGPRRNITDPESRLMPVRSGGFIQGYNCQAVTSADGLVLATSVGNNPTDTGQFQPMMAAAEQAAQLINHARSHGDRNRDGYGEVIELILADAGYFSIDNLNAPGPDRLIALGKARDTERAARVDPATGAPDPEAGPVAAMRHRLRTAEGIAAYRRRSHIAETTFGQAKHNRGFDRFSGRGLTNAAGEWAFNGLVHNLLKALTAGRLTTLTS